MEPNTQQIDVSPEEAKGALGFITAMSHKMMIPEEPMMDEQPSIDNMDEEGALSAQDMNPDDFDVVFDDEEGFNDDIETTEEPEIDKEELKKEITEDLKKGIKEEIRGEIKKILDSDE